MKKTILIIARGYLPGYRHGGPVRSISAIVENLGTEYRFFVVTSIYDAGSTEPYPGVVPLEWTDVGHARVLYRPGWSMSPRFLRRLVDEVKPDLIYLNSFFAPESTLLLLWRRLAIIPPVPVLVAPRGELGAGALQHKSRKKRIFIAGIRRLRLYRNITVHATAQMEKDEIAACLGEDTRILVAPNIPGSVPAEPPGADDPSSPGKIPGSARFLFLARIVPKKNLLHALRLLTHVPGRVQFHVYGPIEDQPYWRQCIEQAKRLPGNVEFAYCGEVSPPQLSSTLSHYDFFLFPTRNENFGHTIAEALQHGLPVLISDQTPWSSLQQEGIGWDLPLDSLDAWRTALNACVAMSNEEYSAMSARARQHVASWMLQHGGLDASRMLFQEALGGCDCDRA